MENLNFQIVGLKPLLFNKFNVEMISSVSKPKEGTIGNNPEEWRDKLFEQKDQLYLPSSYWFSCFCAGGVFTKAGRGTIKSKVAAALVVDNDISLINRYLPKDWATMNTSDFTREFTQPVYLDIRGVMNPNSKGRNVRYRIACSPGWETQVSVSYDNTILSKNQIIKCIVDSGKLVGIGDGRTLGFGRFDANVC